MPRSKGTSLLEVKELNRLQIRRVVYHQAPVTRQQIARELGVSLPTVTTNVATMLAEGLLTEYELPAGPASPQGGRKPQALDFRADAHFAVGIEFGPYQTFVCLTDLRGGVRCQQALPLAPQDYGEMLGLVRGQVEGLCGQAGLRPGQLLGVGVGLPGFVNSRRGMMRTGLHASWAGKALAADLEERTGLRVWVDNNVRMRTVWHEMFSRQSTPSTFAYLFVSKGIACPLMIKNDVLAGHRASAGEIGHTTIQPGGPVCPGCGRKGCLEAVAGETALLAQAQAALDEGRAPILASCVRQAGGALTARELLAAQNAGDGAVCAILEGAMSYLGLAVANIFNFISPGLVVVDGLLFQNESNRRQLQQTARQNLYGLAPDEAKIEFLPYEPYLGAYGAAACVVRQALLG